MTKEEKNQWGEGWHSDVSYGWRRSRSYKFRFKK